MSTELAHKVALVDYDAALFAPIGFEAERLAQAGAQWVLAQCRTAEEIVAMARDADVVIVQTSKPLLTAPVIAQLERARCLIRAGAGYDSIDYEAAADLGIMVCNAPTYCTEDVADHAVALMLASLRHIPRLDAATRKGRYARELAVPTRRVKGSTLGIIGLGRIGGTVARNVKGWDMRVIAYDPYIDQARADTLGVELMDLNALLEQSDFVTIHCPLYPETHHMLSWDQFTRIKPGCIVVNTARGPIIDEAALIDALRSGRVWAAGLDVTEIEPLPADSPLLAFDNVIATPHIAANSPQARHDLYVLLCDICAEVVQGRIPPFVVNPRAFERLRPLR